jgi:serine/threonine protein kinase/Flp pilus assembly protein TadD
MNDPTRPEKSRQFLGEPRSLDLETTAGTAAGEALGAAAPPAARPEPDDWRLPPRYQPRGEIARGGMGVVLRVHDIEVDRPLAVKLLLKHDAAAQRVRRFLEEARITGQLQHPGIPPVHEIGQLAGGRPFFSMKLIAGRTLAELLRERPSPQADLPRFIQIFEQIAQTVAYAHSQGVIHRDLKPLNIMVGAFGEVQVMDWGLAKRLRPTDPAAEPPLHTGIAEEEIESESPSSETADYAPAGAEERTRAGQVMGTFAYMPPEQARGDVKRLDERSDVFGLGAILCQVLTGAPPYRSTEQRDLWRQARAGDLTDALARLDSCGAEAELIALARRYLAADPDERPANAGAVAEQITAHVRSMQERLQQAERERAVAAAKSIEERKRRRWQLALAASVLALVLGGSATGVWYYQDRANRMAEEARQESELAVRQQQLDRDISSALDEAQRVHDDLYGQLADARSAQALLSDIDAWQTRVQAERSAWQRAERLAAVESALLSAAVAERLHAVAQQIEADEADWQWVKKSDALRLGEMEVADDLAREKEEAEKLAAFFRDELKLDVDRANAETTAVAGRIRQSPLRHVLVAYLDHWGKIAIAGEQIHRIMAVARLADPDPWRDQVRDPKVWEDRAHLEQLAREADVSRNPPQILLLLAKRLRAKGKNDYALLQTTLAEYPRDFWLYETLVRSTRDKTEKIGYLQAALAVRPRNFMIHGRLGACLDNWRQDRDGAIQHYRMALSINPRDARSHYNLACALWAKGDLDGAIQHCLAAQENNPRFAVLGHIIIGEALADKHDREGAIAHLRLAQQTASDGHALYTLGTAWRRIEHWDEAIAAYRKAIKGSPGYYYSYSGLAIALAAKGELDEVRTFLQKTKTIEPKILPSSAHAVIRYDAACGLILSGCGKTSMASQFNEARRVQLRQQACDWLRDDLQQYRQQIQGGNPEAARNIAAKMTSWQQDTDLAGVREPKELAKLPEAERQAWERMWSEVKELARQADSRAHY